MNRPVPYGLLTILCLASSASAAPLKRYAQPAADGETVGCYISTGDNNVLFHAPPVDSRATIDGFFDILQKVYGAKVVYWRALQADQMQRYGVRRDENFHYRDFMDWEKRLNTDQGVGQYGVEAAHARGMEIWGVGALFDQGGHAVVDTTSKGYGPWFVETRIRTEHPEWIPMDRHGLRRMSGPVCFEYPEARQTLVDMFVDLATSAGYDGIMFHMYVEQFFLRFVDEFVFNPATVAAYRERYGVDITEEDFDPYAMARLRGEYLTQFFRELKEALRPHGVKVGFFLDPQNPDYPQPWLADRDVIVSGRIKLDWRRYIREGLVDEVMVYCNGEVYHTINDVLQEARGTDCRVSTIHSSAFPEAYRHLRAAGVVRTIAGGYEGLEAGSFELLPPEALKSEDFIRRLTVVRQMADGDTDADLGALIAATQDPHVLVRRHAVRALGSLNATNAAAVAAAETCLTDAENAVRCYTVDTVCKIGTAQSIDRLYEMLAEHSNVMIDGAARSGLANGGEERTVDIVRGLSHTSASVRSVAAGACAYGRLRPEVLAALLARLQDPAADVRWGVARALGRFPQPESLAALQTLVADEHPTVANMAAMKLSETLRSQSRWVGATQLQAWRLLRDRFAAHGDAYQGADRDWGWRCFGEALERMGPRGVESLESFLAQDADATLADHAWRILHVKLSGHRYLPITPAEAEKGYRLHPRLRDAAPAPPALPPEPQLMPHIVQNFEGEVFVPWTAGDVGDYRHHSACWRGFGSSVLSPAIVEAPADGQGKVIRLVRAPKGVRQYVEGLRADYRPRTGQCRIRLDVRLDSADSGLTVWLTSSGAWRSSLAVTVNAGGKVSYRTAEGRTVVSDVALTPGTWHRLEILADLDATVYSAWAVSDGQRVPVGTDVPLKPDEEYNVLLLFAGGNEGGTTYVDNVNVTASNPAWVAP